MHVSRALSSVVMVIVTMCTKAVCSISLATAVSASILAAMLAALKEEKKKTDFSFSLFQVGCICIASLSRVDYCIASELDQSFAVTLSTLPPHQGSQALQCPCCHCCTVWLAHILQHRMYLENKRASSLSIHSYLFTTVLDLCNQ